MKAQEIMDALKGKKGQHVQAVWQRVCKTSKKWDGLICKRTMAWVRSGISYANLQDIKDAIERGEREPVEGLPWGQWREGCANYIIDHNGQEYIRLYPATFDNLQNSVEYTLNGKPATYAECEPHLLASEKHKPEDERPACFTVKADSVLTIGD
jgi:hypothetical protein